MNNTRNIVRLLVTHGKCLLLAKVLKKGFFFLPGGGIEYNEALYAAAERELWEELNVAKEEIYLIEPIGVYEHSWNDNGSPFHELNIICQCSIKGFSSGTPVRSAERHLGFEWIDLTALGKIDLRPEAFKTLIPQWCEGQRMRQFFASSMLDRSQG